MYSPVPNKRHVTLISYFKKIEPFCPYLGRDAYFLIQNLWGVTSIWDMTLIRITQKVKLLVILGISYNNAIGSIIPANDAELDQIFIHISTRSLSGLPIQVLTL